MFREDRRLYHPDSFRKKPDKSQKDPKISFELDLISYHCSSSISQLRFIIVNRVVTVEIEGKKILNFTSNCRASKLQWVILWAQKVKKSPYWWVLRHTEHFSVFLQTFWLPIEVLVSIPVKPSKVWLLACSLQRFLSFWNVPSVTLAECKANSNWV